MSTAKLFLFIGSLAAGLAVGCGAFGAHALRARLPADAMSAYLTAVQYHFYHALGLILLGLVAFHLPHSTVLRAAGWLMFAGIVLFSGSLYAISMGGARGLGIITPFGGAALIAAWLLAAFAAFRG